MKGGNSFCEKKLGLKHSYLEYKNKTELRIFSI